jgi:hypothetical protein
MEKYFIDIGIKSSKQNNEIPGKRGSSVMKWIVGQGGDLKEEKTTKFYIELW